ncbi:MAG: hypothetical protein J5616_06565 [Bacteroidaceae bacterium]|nr:hypothetical protein [Bacteroidaceae bacterium]
MAVFYDVQQDGTFLGVQRYEESIKAPEKQSLQGIIFILPQRVNQILPERVNVACPRGSNARGFSNVLFLNPTKLLFFFSASNEKTRAA